MAFSRKSRGALGTRCRFTFHIAFQTIQGQSTRLQASCSNTTAKHFFEWTVEHMELKLAGTRSEQNWGLIQSFQSCNHLMMSHAVPPGMVQLVCNTTARHWTSWIRWKCRGSNQMTLWFDSVTTCSVFYHMGVSKKMDDLGVPPFLETSICSDYVNRLQKLTFFLCTLEDVFQMQHDIGPMFALKNSHILSVCWRFQSLPLPDRGEHPRTQTTSAWLHMSTWNVFFWDILDPPPQ